jgi:competence protein ComEC
MPRRVRVRVPKTTTALSPGDAVSVKASLLPPAGPALPGAYDFARTAWFMGLGAVGSARTPTEPAVISEPMPLSLSLWLPVERLRQRISRRMTEALPGETGAIAAALVTGERGGISEATNQAYRDSGIFHILSISGLHMTIFAGAVYFATRFLLSLVPMLALRFEIKKWAAVAGLLGTFGYLMISGGSPPAVRSAIMLSVMFLAVLLDRPALALRNVALAALVILVVTPPSLIDVGFQMSFAAVVALVTGIEAWQAWRHQRLLDREPRAAGPLTAAAAFLGTVTLTTLIATAAVAPFAAYYFHKSTQYGVLANLVAVPICNLLVMPAALATLIALPAGLEAWPLAVMGLGIDAMTWVAYRVAAIPGAVSLVPAISGLAFGLMVAGGLWLCLWGSRWRLLGLAPIALGIVLAPLREAPDVLIGAGGALVGVRGPDGRLAALDTARSGFELGRWLEHDADSRAPADVGPGRVIRCDAIGCNAKARGIVVAIARHPAALVDDCRAAGLIVWLGEGEPVCGPRKNGVRARIVARTHVAREGTHVVRLARAARWPPASTAGARAQPPSASGETMTPAEITIETVASWRGRRPWSAVRATTRTGDP